MLLMLIHFLTGFVIGFEVAVGFVVVVGCGVGGRLGEMRGLGGDFPGRVRANTSNDGQSPSEYENS